MKEKMMAEQNPFGLHTVTPYLIVEDVKRLILFFQEVFSGDLRGDIHYRDDGSIKHAEIVIGDSVIMMGSPMESIGSMSTTLYIYVPDCDQTYKFALTKGAISIFPPENFPHGDRYGGIKDPTGNIFWVVTHQRDENKT
jgi:uncharacterized glyoxalase superfamily protein PhnB